MTKGDLLDPVETYPNNTSSHAASDDWGCGELLQDYDTRTVSCEKHISPGQLAKRAKSFTAHETAVEGTSYDQRPLRTVPHRTP